MSREPIYLSKNGRAKLEQELLSLKSQERPKIVAEITRAMQLGDLSENAEYHAAKEAQQHLERRIADLEDKLSRVRSVDLDRIPTDKAYVFSRVVVQNLDNKRERLEYKLMPAEEADVDNDEISVRSPIGVGLLGKGVGEEVQIKIPVGELRYKILKISRD
ncbi:MAG: transcription elongation factor GreA [Candidatus Zixiibacteriota bacterium]